MICARYAPRLTGNAINTSGLESASDWYWKSSGMPTVIPYLAVRSSRQIGEALVQRKGLANSTEMIEQMQKNAIAVMKRLESTAIVVPAGQDGAGRTWRLV